MSSASQLDTRCGGNVVHDLHGTVRPLAHLGALWLSRDQALERL